MKFSIKSGIRLNVSTHIFIKRVSLKSFIMNYLL